MRIWIVSPDPPLKAFSGLLEKHGQEVVGSSSILDDLLKILSEVQADVILLNRYTPGTMTVAGVLWQVRSQRPDLRVMLLLGEEDNDAKGIKAAAVSAGVYDWHVGRSVDSSVVDMIERPRSFADVVGQVPPEAVRPQRSDATQPVEPEPTPEAGRPRRGLRLPSISVSSIPLPPSMAGGDKHRDRRVSVPHLLYGIVSPSPGAAFRAAQGMGAAWRAAGGDAAAVSLDLFTDPWPAGPCSGLKVYETRRDGLRWYGFGTLLTQETLPKLDDIQQDPRWREGVAQTVRGIYRRRSSKAAATVLAFGNPWLDPLARAGWPLFDVLLLVMETAEDSHVCAQWCALWESLDLLPARTVSLVSLGGRAVTDEVWDVRNGWDKIIARLLPAGRDVVDDAGAQE
ncbi:MAG: hypothetical protein M0Z66_02160 [Thermaerobacter sp.]|nr:hypothetical protein [Thermaerobacter sp.]